MRSSDLNPDHQYQLQKLSHRHEEILMWLLLNPDKPQGECAKQLGYTMGWVSQVINSDLFQARLADLRQKDFEVSVLSIREKMTAAADIALDRMIDRLEVTTDIDSIRQCADTALKRLGYGARPGAVQGDVQIVQNNTLVLNAAQKETLGTARRLLAHLKSITPPLQGEDDQERGADGKVTDRNIAIESTATEVPGTA